MNRKGTTAKIIWGVVILTIVMGGLYLTRQFLDSLICTNEIVSVSESPDRQLKAIVFHRECGATVGDNLQVSVTNILFPLSQDAGNVLIEDRGHNDSVSLNASLRWLGNRRLLIVHDAKARTFKTETKLFALGWPPWQPVLVEYESLVDIAPGANSVSK